MLDLVFLIIMIITLVRALNGKYSETAGNFAFVIGLIASVVGLAREFIQKSGSGTMVLLNILILLIAFVLKPISRLLVQLYNDKIAAHEQKLEDLRERDSNGERAFFTDDNFDDPDLRFNGEFTDFKL